MYEIGEKFKCCVCEGIIEIGKDNLIQKGEGEYYHKDCYNDLTPSCKAERLEKEK